MKGRTENAMNLKLNNDVRPVVLLPNMKHESTIKEERRRTGRYIAVLVGICLFLLAIYHAWVRRIPIVASLVVPALIMFVYVGWVLYTASRDKHKLLDAEAALAAATAAAAAGATSDENDPHTSETPNNIEISAISSKESSKENSPQVSRKNWDQFSLALLKGESKDTKAIKIDGNTSRLVKPVILVNDKPPEDLDLKWTNIVESVANMEKFKAFQTRRKFKRKFCRSRRNAVFKRSYSIA